MSLSREKERLLERLKNSRLRRKEGLFLVEGIRGSEEFLTATLPVNIQFALVSPRLEALSGGAGMRQALEGTRVPLHPVSDHDLRRYCDTEEPQGILLVVQEPRIRGEDQPLTGTDRSSRLLVLDGIQDPGNVGTLLRGARAFGLDGVIALDGTADPWGPKAVRASAGALAHLQVVRMPVQDALAWLQELALPIFVAEAGGRDVRSFRSSGGWALALGNEGAGSRPELREAAADVLSIPMAPGVDSLNVAVAGSILLFSLGGSGSGTAESEAERMG